MSTPFTPEFPLPDSVTTNGSESAWFFVGFWPRVLASLIDTVVQAGIVFAFYIVYRVVKGTAVPDGRDWPLNIVFIALVIWMWMKFGATPGKMYIHAQVLDAQTGRRLRLGQSIIRYLSYIVSAVPLCFGFLAVVWNARHQGWHDRIAGTVVVRPGRWELGADGKPQLR